MIVETIFSTLDEEGRPNFAPMGLLFNGDFIFIRPYRKTQTCRNLLSSGHGVANLADDVLAYVQCGLYGIILPHFPAAAAPGAVYDGTCSWMEMSVIEEKGTAERAEFRCQVLHRGIKKEFTGFCRAHYAVIEAAILATRLDLTDRKIMAEKLIHYGEIVRKTGSDAENQAFQLVHDYIRKRGKE